MTSTAIKLTPKKYKQGDKREDGRFFSHYQKSGEEQWLSPEAYHHRKLNNTLWNCKWRAKELDIPFTITIDDLIELYPKDNRCPVLGTLMEWGDSNGGRSTSPSLDRIRPELGYVKGNVCFISSRANTIKYNATTDELFRVANYMKEATAA